MKMTKAKRINVLYWITTLWLALGMVSTGLVQIMHTKTEVDLMAGLGYPIYFLTIIGVWKILGTIVVLIPRARLLKEWAYAGFFFCMSGAIVSHLAVGGTIVDTLPATLLLILTILSRYFRPASRRFTTA